jgi:nicotinamidase-related amidase
MDITRHDALLRRGDTLLLAIDLQDTFLKVIHDADRVVNNGRLLIQSAQILHVPIIATTQNAARLGAVDARISALFTSAVIDKMTFSAASTPAVAAALEATGRKQVIICGVETHICIAQTAMDLVASGFQVHVVADAVSARSMEKHKLGMERIRDAGVLPIASEAAVYELLGEAGTPEFRQILPLVK